MSLNLQKQNYMKKLQKYVIYLLNGGPKVINELQGITSEGLISLWEIEKKQTESDLAKRVGDQFEQNDFCHEQSFALAMAEKKHA